MLEFLQDCNSEFNILNLAIDCEKSLTQSNSILAFGVFFEKTLTYLFLKYFPEDYKKLESENKKGVNYYSDILNSAPLRKKIKEEFHFDDFNNVDTIRRYRNDYAHKINPKGITDEQKKFFFEFVFKFCAKYYQHKTNKKAPQWNEQSYSELLIDKSVLKEQNQALANQKKALEKDNIELSREIEQLTHNLEKTKEAALSPEKQKEYARLKEENKTLYEEKTETQRRLILQNKKLHEVEKEKSVAEKELQTLRSENTEKNILTENARIQIEYKLENLSKKVDSLQAEKNDLISRNILIEEKYNQQVKELQAIIDQNETKEIRFLKQQLEDLQKKNNEIVKKLNETQQLLAESRAKKYYTDSELEQVSKEFYTDRDNSALQDQAAHERLEILSPKIPKCPQCNSILSVGFKGGNYFWKCPAWKSDNQGCTAKTRSVTPLEFSLAKELYDLDNTIKKLESGYTNGKKYIVPEAVLNKFKGPTIEYEAYPTSFEALIPKGYVFQSLAVPSSLFDDRDTLKALNSFSRFILSSNIRQNPVAKTERTIYSLALRLLNRGIILSEEHERVVQALENKFNIKKFGRLNSLFEYVEYGEPEFWFDSPCEKLFAQNILAPLLGHQWATYTLTQAGFDVLLPDQQNKFHDQRVDFFIQKNGKKIVVEIDGPEHARQEPFDKTRDNALTNRGFIVLRFTNDQIVANDPEVKHQMLQALGENYRKEINVALDDRYIVACKLMHQLSISIMKMLETGMIGKNANLFLQVSTKMFSKAEQNYILTLAIEEVCDILEHYASIYGEDLHLNLFDNTTDPCTIFVGNGIENASNHVLIRDCFLPYDQLCNIEPFGEGVFPQKCTKEDLEFFLKYIFGFDKFRNGQFEAITRLLMRKDSIILLPTGAGKSIIYQLASFIAPGMIVIISPLRSLMEDQVSNLNFNRGITNAIMIRSENTTEGQKKRDASLRLIQHNSTSMLYIAPERLQIPSFRERISDMMEHNSVFAVAIDEAHCISEWGHDFRPAYLNIANATRILFKKGDYTPTLFALTGTASGHVLQDIKATLEIESEDAVVTLSSFDRQELKYSVVHCHSLEKTARIEQLIREDIPNKFHISYEQLAKLDGKNTYSGIVFTPLAARGKPSQYDALSVGHELDKRLDEMGIACYFSKTPKTFDEKTWEKLIQERSESFKKNKLNVLVATKAFGMGIDKSNIRFIIHDGIPSSLEEYYQEVGRAGRGRDVSQCVLVFSDNLKEKHEPLLEPDLALDQMRSSFDNQKNDPERDDLNAILYFHTGAYKGVEAEFEVVKTVIDKLNSDNLKPGQTKAYYLQQMDSIKDSEMMQALMRLITLGIVSDYTYDYKGCFVLTFGSTEPDEIARHYIAYIRRDNEQRVEEAEKAMASIERSKDNFAIKAAKTLIEYIYDSVEKSRRAAVRLMYTTVKEIADLETEEQDKRLREAINSYFGKGETAKDIPSLLKANNAGLSGILQFLPVQIEDREYSETDHEKLRDIFFRVGRLLESTPDQPALLILRGLSSMILYPNETNSVVNDLIAAFRFAKERYGVDSDILVEESADVLTRVACFYPAIFESVLSAIPKTGVSKFDILSNMLQKKDLSDDQRDYLLTVFLDERVNALFD